jgi:drug/metabolite transporter (DMT)-like permease
LGEPIGSSLLALLLLDETPTWLMVVGAVFILSGILIASLRGNKTISDLEIEAGLD